MFFYFYKYTFLGVSNLYCIFYNFLQYFVLFTRKTKFFNNINKQYNIDIILIILSASSPEDWSQLIRLINEDGDKQHYTIINAGT